MKKFNFIWSIENYSYCWYNKGKELVSPTFFVEFLQQTSWNLGLYPRGYEDECYISLYLNRREDCNGPERIALNYELSFLNSNGTANTSIEVEEDEFEKGKAFGSSYFYKRSETNLQLKNKVLISDTLRVCCTMWMGEGKIDKEDFICARTRIGLEKISFISIIKNFSSLKPNQKKIITTGEEKFFFGYIYIKSEPSSEKEVILKIAPNSMKSPIIICQIYLLNSTGKEIECGKIDTRDDTHMKHVLSFPIVSGRNLLDEKLEYLPNDNLTLRCVCTISSGLEFQRIEETFHDLHLTPFLKKRLRESGIASFTSASKSALDDLKSLYKDQILSDVQLKTMNKTFLAHKSILCARSPVFRIMLTTDMIEKTQSAIEVDDLDDSTIDQFLLFLYTDVLEDLQWKSAIKLYYAADKYQVQRLKDMCSTFLVTVLNTFNISDLLILADRHLDSSLQTAVENFICENKKQIFCTVEWEIFMLTNPQLAMKTMHFYLKNSSD